MAENLPAAFAAAVREGRYHDAATDPSLFARWRDHGDLRARALLILCAAHHHMQNGNAEGARIKIGRAVRCLEQLPLDPFAAVLIEHARASLGALQAGRPAPHLPLGFE